jgi:alkaline phosphatase D
VARNPHVKMVELNKRGYLLVDINRERLHSEWWHVPTVRERTDEQWLAAQLVSETGTNHLARTDVASKSRGDAPDPAPAAE